MEKVLILNSSEKSKTLKALETAAKKAAPATAKKLQALHDALKTNPTAGRARREKEPSMKRKTTRRVKRTRRTTRTNPTASATAGSFRRRARSAGAGVAAKLKNVNIGGLVMRGACMAGGFLAQSFIARQSERLLPSLPRMAHSVIGSGVVAAAALMMAGGKPWAEDIAASAVAAGIQGLAHEFAPGVFAGLHENDVYVQGFEDGGQYYAQAVNGLAEGEENVQGLGYMDEGVEGLGGLAFSSKRLPADLPNRPDGF